MTKGVYKKQQKSILLHQGGGQYFGAFLFGRNAMFKIKAYQPISWFKDSLKR